MSELETEVLVVGGGPVGLALAGDLGWRGRSCLLVERGDGSIEQPKMDLVGVRTMEFCRRWGLVADVEAAPYDRDYPQDNVYLTALNGYELGRQPMPSMRDERPPPESPQKRERCPQNMFDPILRRFAERWPTNRLLYRHELLSFEQASDHVLARVAKRSTGEELLVRARFLVGADGAASTVREQLRIGMDGRGVLTYTTNVIFRCPEFNALHNKRPGYRYMFVGPDGVWATIVAINGRDQWRMSVIGDARERRTYTTEELREIACKLLGRAFEPEILSVLPWIRAELVAERYHEGRVFLCGDACHRTSPTGGLGMNTGIGDAVDLSWKLDALLSGWCGSALVESYGRERRPVAQRITRFSTGNLQTMKSVKSGDEIYQNTPAGDATRQRIGRQLAEGLRREWFSLNMHLGYRYVDSPICVYDEAEDPEALQSEFEEPTNYIPTSRPGARAPHAWLRSGQSMLDLFGRGLVLLDFGSTSDAARLEDAAKRSDIPLKVERIDEPSIAELYAKRYVLVRPDGHVAWRGDAIPDDPEGLLGKVTGRLEGGSE